VLTNLLANAIKFTERGRVSLEAALLDQSAAQARVRLAVRDTGIGISTDRQQAVFDTFTQADGSTARRYGGTGLGLTISRHLIELMGGRIGLDSEPGCGSSFWVEIALEKQLDRAAGGSHPPPGLTDLRVLVVDAYAATRHVLRAQLERWGCVVDEAETPAAAMRALRAAAERDPYRLMLLDLDMPGADGELTAESINADAQLAPLAVVVLCSTGGRAARAHERAQGFAGAVSKPVHCAQLREAVSAAATRLRAGALAAPAGERGNRDAPAGRR
jgi:CheY-like chemotaxis protein